MSQGLKAKPGVEPLGVSRREQEATYLLEFRMREDGLHQAACDASTSVFLHHKHVRQIRDAREVRHHAGKSHLRFSLERAEAK